MTQTSPLHRIIQFVRRNIGTPLFDGFLHHSNVSDHRRRELNLDALEPRVLFSAAPVEAAPEVDETETV